MKLIAVLLFGAVFTAPSRLHAQETDLLTPPLAQIPRTLR